MNLRQLRKEAKLWQKKLGLTSWKITVMWAEPKELDNEDEIVYGLNIFDANHMESTIKIRNPKYGDSKYDPVETLVHELLHLFVFPLESAAGFSIKPPSDQWETALEQTINKLSKLLLVKEENGRADSVGGDGQDRPG